MKMLFAENIDSELFEIPIPDVNGKLECEKCGCSKSWEHVDHDYSDPEDFKKQITFRCMGWLSGLGFARRCENDVTLYLDENNLPIFSKDEA